MNPAPISIFIPSVNGGGAERAMLVFGDQLIKRGFSVELVVASLEGALRDRIPPGVEVVNLNQPRMLRALPKLTQYLIKRKPCALFSTITHANIAASCAARCTGFQNPLIVRQSNAPISECKTTLASRVAIRLIPHAYRLAQGIIAVSQGVKDELLILQPSLESRIQVIPTPVLTDEIRAMGEEMPSHPWFADSRVPVIVSAGRLKKHKGMLDLVRAFARVRRRTQARLLILGEGSDRARIEAEVEKLGISEDVALPGYMYNPFSSMNRAALFVLASHYEGLPNVLIQAMAFGTPVVSTDCKSGPSEILEDGKLGRMVRVGALDDLARAIEESLSLPRREDARQSVWERFGAASATSRYLALAGLPPTM